ncbi:MAG: hypothetical protein O3C27_07205 [Actinomycetota bacterium]|nr:hypothetical protein [Actinomycetota bacterium]
MPVARRGANGARQLAILGFATVGGLAAMWLLFSRATDLASSGQVDVNLGSSVFQAGNIDRLSDDIDDTGPLFFPDLVGRDRDIYLQHVGDDPETGWSAFAVRPLDSARACFVKWEPDDRIFVDNCDQTTYPETGEGLPSYPVLIDAEGNLSVDINAAERPSGSSD